MDAPLSLLFIALVFMLAGTVKGITGMGLPTVAVSLLGLAMPPTQAAALLVLPSLLTNLAQCRGPHTRDLAAALWPLWLGLVTAVLLTPAANPALPDPHQLLGVALLAYGGWGLMRRAHTPGPAPQGLCRGALKAGLLAGLVGLLTGAITALTAVFVIPLVPYLQALRLPRDRLIQAQGLCFMVATLALALRLQASPQAPLWSFDTLLALATALAGMALGGRWRQRLSGPAFQRALFLVLMGLGLANLLHGR